MLNKAVRMHAANDLRLDTFEMPAIKEDEIEIAVQMNGKVKAKLMVAAEADEATVKAQVHADETIAALLEGKNIVKELYVKGRLYNIVVK